MKKNYSALIALFLLGSFATFAALPQKGSTKNSIFENKNLLQVDNSALRNGNHTNHTASVFWSDDFSNSANWVINHEVGTTGDWEITTTGPSGIFVYDTIHSTTRANGFALFDSDNQCYMLGTGGNQIGNITNATPINCTGHPNINLEFQEYYKRNYDSTYVYVSNDNINWTLFPVNASFASGTVCSTNPTVVDIDISSVAGNQATVYVRFTFYSPTAQGGCDYSWMVDDVSLLDIITDDVAMLNTAFPSEYTSIPLIQVQPFNFDSRVLNLGLNSATNVSVAVDVFKNSWSNNVHSVTSSIAATVLPGDTTAILSSTSYTPTDTGVYLIRYIAQMTATDLVHSNDTLYRFVIVSENSYARDYAFLGSLNNFLGNNGNTMSIGEVYDIYTLTYLNGVTCYLYNPTVGDSISASAYQFTFAGAVGSLIGSTPSHIITTADSINGFVSLYYDTPVPFNMSPYPQYLVTINQLNSNPMNLGFTNKVFTPNRAWYSIGGGSWSTCEGYGYPGSFVIRPEFISNPVGLNNVHSNNGIDVYPNPSNGIINIRNSGAKEKFNVKIYNALGQVVYSEMFNKFFTTVDLSHQPSGIYHVRLEGELQIISKSIMISNK